MNVSIIAFLPIFNIGRAEKWACGTPGLYHEMSVVGLVFDTAITHKDIHTRCQAWSQLHVPSEHAHGPIRRLSKDLVRRPG